MYMQTRHQCVTHFGQVLQSSRLSAVHSVSLSMQKLTQCELRALWLPTKTKQSTNDTVAKHFLTSRLQEKGEVFNGTKNGH